jgi:hypothetical protein
MPFLLLVIIAEQLHELRITAAGQQRKVVEAGVFIFEGAIQLYSTRHF